MCGTGIAKQVRSVLENSPEAFQSAMVRVVLAVASAITRLSMMILMFGMLKSCRDAHVL